MNISLVKELALTDFKLRYKNSVLGYLWSLLKPLAIFASLYFVYSLIIRFDIPYYPLFLLLGILLWNYFTEATINGMHSLVAKSSMLTKVNVDKRAIVLASNITTVLTLLLNLAIFFGFVAILKPGFSWSYLFVIVTIANLFMISLGLSFILSAIFVRLRDLSSIWEIVLQIGFWITPIIYPLSLVPAKYVPFMEMNPLHRVIDEARLALIYGNVPNLSVLLQTLTISLFVLSVGYIFMTRRMGTLSENL